MSTDTISNYYSHSNNEAIWSRYACDFYKATDNVSIKRNISSLRMNSSEIFNSYQRMNKTLSNYTNKSFEEILQFSNI